MSATYSNHFINKIETVDQSTSAMYSITPFYDVPCDDIALPDFGPICQRDRLGRFPRLRC